jgi:hypothetical protein
MRRLAGRDGKQYSSFETDVRVSADLIYFQTDEILWHGSAWGDAVVEKRSVSELFPSCLWGSEARYKSWPPQCRIISSQNSAYFEELHVRGRN